MLSNEHFLGIVKNIHDKIIDHHYGILFSDSGSNYTAKVFQ